MLCSRIRALWLIVVLSLVGSFQSEVCAAEPDKGVRELLSARRVVFLGDSITYSGQYIAYVETYLRTRFPKRDFEFLDLGLPSETVSGLSEPGHAGGKFPRPDVHERLGRVLAKIKPDLVVACYGMNCGMYHPFSEERFAKYREGIQKLRDAASASGAKVIHLTPPTFDPLPLAGRTLPAGLDSYTQPFEGYNEVLGKYSEWLLKQRAAGWAVIDIHGPMDAHIAARRRDDPKFVLAGDGVHANPTGHWVMALQVVQSLGLLAETNIITFDLAKAVRLPDGSLAVVWGTRLPMAIDPQWDAKSLALEKTAEKLIRYRLEATGATAARYDLFDKDTLVTTATRAELERGMDPTSFPLLGSNQRALELFKLVTRRQRLLTDAWLTETGHQRPGMAKGLPIEEATKQATELGKQIRELSQPVTLQLRFAPAAEPFPGKKSAWNGFDRFDFVVAGKTATVVVPKEVAKGRPWVWHGEFFGHKPAPDIALLGHGFHCVSLSVPDMLGSPEAVAHWNDLYRELTEKYDFSPKPALVGLSRGGLYCYNWAAANQDKVACIYGDAPVCDFKSWPGGRGKGKGSPRDWKLVLERFHFANDADALAYDKNPVDNLAPLAKAKVPLLHVYGDADDVVPWDENTGLIAERYRKLGGEITLIAKPGVGHHPHGLEDSTPIVEFIRKHATSAK
jgi:pimeloyl-ACP methyl ester carboxylesterase/lysophospholipase L1-like esterase